MEGDDDISALMDSFDGNFGNFTAEDMSLFEFDSSIVPDFMDVPEVEPVPSFQSGSGIGDVNDPLPDPVYGNEIPGETSGANQNLPETEAPYSGFGEPVGIPVWPIPPVPYSCTCCQVLREITHTNGDNFTKLGIHGTLGIISHVILETRYGTACSRPQYQMFDFCKKSIEGVRELLAQYCKDRKQAGYVMLQDPFVPFYEALCVGMNNKDGDDFLIDFNDLFGTSDLHPSAPHATNNDQITQPQFVNEMEQETGVRRPRRKSAMAAQRERTKALTLKDFAWCSCFPAEKAAKKMKVCTTVLKNISRRHGLMRWPYRKINSLETQISEKNASLSACSEEGKRHVEAEIEALQQKLAAILDAFNRPRRE